MTKEVAFVFPGQGSQVVGMGAELSKAFPIARAVFETADDILSFPVSRLCFESPLEELSLTRHAQPALLAVSRAASAVLHESGVGPAAVAGHSLGEYSALVEAGVIDFETAMRLVAKRAELMQTAADERPGAMSAVLGVDLPAVVEVIEPLTERGTIAVANRNTPAQTVISGEIALIDDAEAALKEAGARVIRLNVSGAFHCGLMAGVRGELAGLIKDIEFRKPSCPVVSNYTGKASIDPAQIKSNLTEQVTGSVLWDATVSELGGLGLDLAVEVGPGRVLRGLIEKTDSRFSVLSGGDVSSINEAAAVVKGGRV